MPETGGGAATKIRPSWIADRRWNSCALDRGRRLLRILRALLEGIERHEDGAGIGRIGEGGAGEADDVHRMRNPGHLQRDFDRLAIDLIGARQRGRRRKLRDDDEIAAVELRDEADRRLAEFVQAEGDDAGIDHQHQHGDAHQLAPTASHSRA